VAIVTETIQVGGVRCERCVLRLAQTLEGAEGLESANASMMGEVQLVYDDEHTTRAALVERMARGGFREQQFVT
jgi:copper chaperone CopZ